MKACKVCGSENNDTARFCGDCGGELQTSSGNWTIRPIWFGLAGLVMYYGGIWMMLFIQNRAVALEVIK